MRNYILVTCVLVFLTVHLGCEARRYRNRVHRIREEGGERQIDHRINEEGGERQIDHRINEEGDERQINRRIKEGGERQIDHRINEAVNERRRDHRRDREQEKTTNSKYKSVEDDAIIIRVPRKHRQRGEDLDRASSNSTNYQLWPGDFQIHQIHYPNPFPVLPQQPPRLFPQYPWVVPQQPPQIHQPQPQYPTHPPQIHQPQYPTHPPQPAPQYPTHPPPQPPPSGPEDGAIVPPPPKQRPPASGKPASCGKSYVQSVDNTRIISGAPAAHGEFPFLVALMIRDGKIQMCGGSLIDDRTVLTAAHCFDGATAADLSDLQVVLGDHNLYHEGEPTVVKRKVEKLISHAHWNKRSNFNDIALLKLASPVEFNHNIQPICLSRSTKSYAPGKQATVAGWGRTSPADGTRQVPQQTPLKITVPIVDQQSCQRSFFRVQISEHMVCAGEGSKSACLGDSGGPLMVRSEGGQGWEQIGIVSWGYNCVGLTVYTRVNEFQDWIEKHRNS